MHNTPMICSPPNCFPKSDFTAQLRLGRFYHINNCRGCKLSLALLIRRFLKIIIIFIILIISQTLIWAEIFSAGCLLQSEVHHSEERQILAGLREKDILNSGDFSLQSHTTTSQDWKDSILTGGLHYF